MKSRSLFALCAALLVFSLGLQARGPRAGGPDSITPAELKEWLSYIASDQLQGRQVYTEGLGLAAAYIADHLKEWGVKPGGDDGSYFQAVKVLGVNVKRNSSVTVTVNGQTKTFKDGEGVTFPASAGGKQTVTARAEFVGYGLSLPELNIDDYKGRDVSGKIAIYVGRGPSALAATQGRLIGARSRNAIELKQAVAAIGPAGGGFGRGGAGRGGQGPSLGDFQTVQRLDAKVPPQITAGDDFFAFIFNASGLDYADIKAKVDARETLPAVALNDVSVTINVDAAYDIVQTRLTRNVVGIVEGRDVRLKDSYVLFGAHYDHIGYLQAPPGEERGGFGGGAGTPNTPGQPRPSAGGCAGQGRDTPRPGDVINNGADDDGSGTVALMAIAKAFATGPKPRRSLMFVWHAGEEAGLLGSRYMADYPSVPLDKVSAQLNIDMIGRNRCDQATEANTVYLVGSDRISSELHNVNEEANAGLPAPLKLDYEFNDPADPESIYTRSDHYSYAAKGIPIIFYTTGLHRDYHYVTDEVGKIEFPKMAHIARLVYETGKKVANLDHLPVRDNQGPRKGKGASGPIGGSS